MPSDEPVILFDGQCNLCDASVQFVLDHERDHELKFAPLESEAGRAILARYGLSPDDNSTVVLIANGQVYTRSTAALRIARHLRWPWRWLAALVVIPRPIRDALYRMIATRRYRWFGRREACRVPDPELAERFLDQRVKK